jgi:hypothetical protein
MAAALSAGAAAQGRRGPGVPAAGIPGSSDGQSLWKDRPYSADTTTTVTRTLGDGTRIEQSVKAKIYRDSAGRVRREQAIIGVSALDPASESSMVISIVDPVAGANIFLYPNAKEARRIVLRGPLGVAPPAPPPPPPPPPPPEGAGAADSSPLIDAKVAAARAQLAARAAEVSKAIAERGAGPVESLGTRQIDGLTAVGTRTKTTIPAGQIGNDRPIDITDEQWKSTDLQVIVLSRHHDPQTGDVEFRMTNISRGEPPAYLFTVPADYKLVSTPPAPPAPPVPPAPPAARVPGVPAPPAAPAPPAPPR